MQDERAEKRKKAAAEIYFTTREAIRAILAASDPDAYVTALKASSKIPQPAAQSAAPATAPAPAIDSARVPIDAEDVARVVKSTTCSRSRAIEALRLTKGDVATAIAAQESRDLRREVEGCECSRLSELVR